MTEENAHNAQVGTICGMLGMAWVIICIAIMPTPAIACCYDSSPPEYSTPIYDDPQQPDQIVDEAPADEVPDIVGTGSGQQIQTSGISAFGGGDSQTGEPIYPAGFVYHIRQLQAESRQLEALMHIKDRLDDAPNDRVARTLLEKQMQKFDLAGPAGQIYLSEYQADDNRFLFADEYLSRTAGAASADSTPSISMIQTEQSDMLSRLKKQIGILFDGVELN